MTTPQAELAALDQGSRWAKKQGNPEEVPTRPYQAQEVTVGTRLALARTSTSTPALWTDCGNAANSALSSQVVNQHIVCMNVDDSLINVLSTELGS